MRIEFLLAVSEEYRQSSLYEDPDYEIKHNSTSTLRIKGMS
jgi:hypothetical protein